MKCKDVQKNLVLFYYQEADTSLQKELKDHLDSCHGCQTFYAQARSTLQNIDDFDLEEIKSTMYWDRFTAQVMEKVQAPKIAKCWQEYIMIPRRLIPAVVAFAILLVVAIPRFRVYQAEKRMEQQLVQELELVEHMDILENLELLENMEELEQWKG